MSKINAKDWEDRWSPEHPVEVRFGSGTVSYLSVDAAIARLSDQWTPDAAREYLVNQGQPLVRFNGSQYVLLTQPPARQEA